MLSTQEITEQLEDLPSYDSISGNDPLPHPDERTALLQEHNECLILEVDLLRKSNIQLEQSNSVLEHQITLIRDQLRLTEESKHLLNANVFLLQKNNKLLQTKNTALIEWLRRSTLDEEQVLLYVDALESCVIVLEDNPEINSLHLKMQELEQCLQQKNEEISLEVEKQVDAKTKQLQENISDLFNKMLEGEVFATLTNDLEEKFTTIIHKEQETFQAEFIERMPLQNELTQEYLEGKTKKLADIKKIRSDEKANLFYNTAYTVFWAKITGFLSLFSELVEKKAGVGEKVVDVSSSLISSLLGGVPFVGSLLETLSAFALKEVGGAIIDYFDGKKTVHILEIIQNPDHAKKVAELFARSLTLRYQTEIQSWDAKHIKEVATLYSNHIYELSIKGKIYDCKDEPVEDKVKVFLAALQEIVTKNTSYGLSTPTTPRTRLKGSEKSLKTSVQEGTQTIRHKLADNEFKVKHASVHLEGVKRQNSGLLETSGKHKEQIDGLKTEVATLKKEAKCRDEEMESLKTELSSLRELIANWLTPSLEATIPGPVIKRTSKGKASSFFTKKTDKKEAKDMFYGEKTPSN